MGEFIRKARKIFLSECGKSKRKMDKKTESSNTDDCMKLRFRGKLLYKRGGCRKRRFGESSENPETGGGNPAY